MKIKEVGVEAPFMEEQGAPQGSPKFLPTSHVYRAGNKQQSQTDQGPDYWGFAPPNSATN